MQGRVLDFKKGSYWEPIVSHNKNLHYINMQIVADANGSFSGRIKEMSTGHVALPLRTKNSILSIEEIASAKQDANENVEISDYNIENKTNLEQAYSENYNISLNGQDIGQRTFLYPFSLETYFTQNPFSEEIRQYPINIGFPITNTFLISIDLKNQYEIVKYSENLHLKLPNNDGELSVVYESYENKLNIRLNVKINTVSYVPEAYQSLREFFGALIKIQSQELIELRKI